MSRLKLINYLSECVFTIMLKSFWCKDFFGGWIKGLAYVQESMIEGTMAFDLTIQIIKGLLPLDWF